MRYCFDWEDISASPLEYEIVTCNQNGVVVGRITKVDGVDCHENGTTFCYKFERSKMNSPFEYAYQHAYSIEESKAIAEVMLKQIGYTFVEKPREKLKSMF